MSLSSLLPSIPWGRGQRSHPRPLLFPTLGTQVNKGPTAEPLREATQRNWDAPSTPPPFSGSGGARQVVDGSPQGKAMGESFPAVRNSKRRLTGQLREKARPCPDHVSLFPEAGRPPQPHIHRKAPWRPKGSYVKGCSTQRPFGRIHLAKRGMRIHRRILRYTKHGEWTRRIKMIVWRKPGRNTS